MVFLWFSGISYVDQHGCSHQWPFSRATSRPVAFGDIHPGFHTRLPQRFTSALFTVKTKQGIKHGAGLLGYNDIMDIYIYTVCIYIYVYIIFPI